MLCGLKLHSTQRVCTVFVHPSLLPSVNADATHRLWTDPLCKVKAWRDCQPSHCQKRAVTQARIGPYNITFLDASKESPLPSLPKGSNLLTQLSVYYWLQKNCICSKIKIHHQLHWFFAIKKPSCCQHTAYLSGCWMYLLPWFICGVSCNMNLLCLRIRHRRSFGAA